MQDAEVNQHLPEITALTKELRTGGNDAMVVWSDEKRKDFVGKFSERSNVSRYISLYTAQLVRDRGLNRHFISEKHTKAFQDLNTRILEVQDRTENVQYRGHYNYSNTVGGRPLTELNQIASEQADTILSGLPPLKVAVEIINPEISKDIEERDRLLDKGKLLFEQADALAGRLDMSEVDQGMSIGEFREFVKERGRKRRDLLAKLEDVGNDATVLDTKINKFLYSGLPGLSQAVVDVITELIEKATALSTLNRRVEEKVMFGDSTAAVTMLQTFEKDELAVSDKVKAQFDQALEKLKLAGVKRVKALKKGK